MVTVLIVLVKSGGDLGECWWSVDDCSDNCMGDTCDSVLVLIMGVVLVVEVVIMVQVAMVLIVMDGEWYWC